MPLGANKAALFGVSGVGGDNYFGDGSDGDVTTSGDLTYTVANKNGSYDGDMVVMQYSQFTVSANDTVTVDQPCRGLFIYVTGNCTVNGTISMEVKGPLADPTASGGSDSAAVNASGLQLPMFVTGGSTPLAAATFAGCGNAAVAVVANGPTSGSGIIFSIARDGAAGGSGVSSGGNGTNATGGQGVAGTTGAAAISTGGGGGGAGASRGGTIAAGDGNKGSCFGGGAGGGGSFPANGTHTGGTGVVYGGAGGAGSSNVGKGAGGGAGNPGGAGDDAGSSGGTGIGGLIWLVVGGDLTFGSSGSLDVSPASSSITGGNGHNGDLANAAGGGSSGGGAIMMLYKGTLTDNTSGTIQAVAGGTSNMKGGVGGTGGFHYDQVN